MNINRYFDLKDLDNILQKKAKPGKIFIGTLDSTASRTVKKYCNQGILFFSFAADKNLAGECTFLVN